ncbi:hypothetical protein [Ectothiorhodospira lacustris]|uniref:hypothetical protein n=1 Tax=Ectothiorhodospira lacustris TaxID=2899127 RepID=UPI001EE86BE9|nr:hypothetical protein [Ectothiorhodospira lacustris]MCG5501534.1 hypothetical protein [Ectothiorhodospira lacustris]MCG5509326.1 hypothetical protein [Ectothiorhodospira lacustris]MCG5521380.1 hypothetical protein [Ectothiorhodospira lacustris]
MCSSETNGLFQSLRASSPDPGDVHELGVRVVDARGQISMDTRITLLNGWDVSTAQGQGQLKATLPKGLYTLRLERAGAVREKTLQLTAELQLQEHEPRRESGLPAFDTVDVHEYYAYTARDLSHRDTDSKGVLLAGHDGSDRGRLFLFVRAARRGAHGGRDIAAALSLHALDGRLLTDFGAEVIVKDENDGWMAFSAPVASGSYVLRFSGLGAMEMLVTVFDGWETQLFIPFEHRPRLERGSLLLARAGQGFDPDDRAAQAVDAGLAGLRDGVDLLPRTERDMLLMGKFDNPMLGLIGAHLLLLDSAPDWPLFQTVLGNLEGLLPGAMDVHALRLAATLRQGGDLPDLAVISPPMLSRGLAAILEASGVRPEIVPEGGFIERISPYLQSGSNWTNWSLEGGGDPRQFSRLADAELDSTLTPEVEQGVGSPGVAVAMEALVAIGAAGRVLPSVLSNIAPATGAGLSEVLTEIARPGVKQVLEWAHTRGGAVTRKVAHQLVMDGIDAALRKAVQRSPLHAPTADLPPWVLSLLAEIHGRGAPVDLAAVAREAHLPLGLLQRALDRPATVSGQTPGGVPPEGK